MRASAPMRRPSAPVDTRRSGKALMSTSRPGATASSFIRSMMFVPPAMYDAAGCDDTVAIATSISAADAKLCGRMCLPLCDVLDRGDDVGICPAAADVAAHAL